MLKEGLLKQVSCESLRWKEKSTDRLADYPFRQTYFIPYDIIQKEQAQ